jgi:hypothetical protein
VNLNNWIYLDRLGLPVIGEVYLTRLMLDLYYIQQVGITWIGWIYLD